MRKNLRKSGIDIIGDIPWGTHFCQFYQTKEDLVDILVPYFKVGLENNEFCMWIVSRLSEVEEAKEYLKRAVPDFDVYLEQGQIELIPSAQWYLNGSIFDSERVLNGWVEKLNKALNNGYDGLRLGNSFRLGKKYWSDLADYEKQANDVIDNYQLIALCTYPLAGCNATEIIDVVINHQFALVKREGKWEQIKSTRHRKAEEKIQNLANIVEYSNDAIITKSLDGIITSWNKGAEQIYGYLAGEVLGKPISILEPSILVGETEELAELVKQGDKIHNYETLRLRKDGKIIDVSLTFSPVFNASEKLTGISTIARDITRSKKAEEKLRNSEDRYRIVTEQTGLVIYDYDLRTDESNWAGAIEEVTGYSFEELQQLGKNFWIRNIYHSDTNHADEIFSNLRMTGGRFNEELRLRRKDGTCISIENSGVCLMDHEGQPYGAIGVLKDISEKKLASKILQENEERYCIATEQTGQIIFDFDLETGEFKLAGAIREVTGYDPEELENLGKSGLIEYVHPEDRLVLFENLKKSFEKMNKIQVEFRFRNKDGNYIYAEKCGVWLKNDEGKVYRAIGVIKNITEWKLAIEKVEASEMKYLSFIQNFHGIAFQFDENFVTIFMHGAVEEITGYSEKEFMSWIKWKDIIHPDDLAFVLKEEETIRNSPSDSYKEIEFRIKHRDGRIRWVREVYQRVQRKDGKLEFYQGAIYDVTERKETEKFLANLETARKKEIHHRIKNNLQVISSLLDLQAEKFNNKECIKDSEILEAFRESQDRVISMALIHEELYKGGGLDTLNFSLYVEKLTKNLFQTYRLGNADTRLDMDLEENIFFDMDTAVPLGIITNELISNSLKYAFSDRDNGRIKIKLCREESRKSEDNRAGNNNEDLKGTNFILTVLDNGIGMPETFNLENLDNLGMQLVTTLVDQLEGEIELKRDNGTEFTIRFTVVEKN
ncbi:MULTISPECIES: PAS domain S-box protein [unclassified Methanosarcina]|uniref:PAS domain S-box protein n=1 Tax=unclassified Methanosarcina TaxID=2644672 RepID=UPI000615CBC9|nr:MULTISPECIES: PAS domain S-box protein [unclassified Methanosarcina]AKB18991.1 sensory transduction histidine kinase [Methanosarcina sp. WWM596]AKB23135.1 sensory transduction histidine kinase [Methanosarcina sp. WH1]